MYLSGPATSAARRNVELIQLKQVTKQKELVQDAECACMCTSKMSLKQALL